MERGMAASLLPIHMARRIRFGTVTAVRIRRGRRRSVMQGSNVLLQQRGQPARPHSSWPYHAQHELWEHAAASHAQAATSDLSHLFAASHEAREPASHALRRVLTAMGRAIRAALTGFSRSRPPSGLESRPVSRHSRRRPHREKTRGGFEKWRKKTLHARGSRRVVSGPGAAHARARITG